MSTCESCCRDYNSHPSVGKPPGAIIFICVKHDSLFCGRALSTTASQNIEPCAAADWDRAARASWQSRCKRYDQSCAHRRDRVRDVTLCSQWQILWVGNRREGQVF